jgi:protocatechuate 3,4-dioxygenase beta subunit
MRAVFFTLLLAMAWLGSGCASQSADLPAATASGCNPTPGSAVGGPDYVPEGAPWQVKLAPGEELAATAENIAAGARGQRLIVSGRVLDTTCRALAGAAVDVWQANADGVYGPPRNDGGVTCCFLTGVARTNTEGRFEIVTVMPGHYSGAPAHLHVAIAGPKGGRLATEIQFADGSAPGDGQINVVSTTTGADGSRRAAFDFVLATGQAA